MRWTSADRLLVQTLLDGRGWNALLLTVDLVRAGGALLLPALLAAAIDGRLAGDGNEALVALAALMTALLGAEVASHLIAPWCVSTLTIGLRRDLLARVLRLGTSDRASLSTGDLTSRLLTNTTETASVVPIFGSWLASLIVSGGALVALAVIDVRLAVAFLAGVPAAMLLIRAFVGRISPLLTRYLEVQGRISGHLVEVLAGIRTVRAAGTERYEIDRILDDLPELHRVGQDSWQAQGVMNLRASLLMPMMQVAVIATAGYALLGGDITPGMLTAASGYAAMALGLFGQANAFMALAQARAGARRITEVTDIEGLPCGDAEPGAGPGELVFSGVTVAGPDGPILHDVGFRVPGGTEVAVVGRSGAGKTTLAAVAGRLIDPDAGEVLLDGVPLDRFSPDALRTEVGWAFERPSFLPGTIGEAIAFGTPGASDDQVRSAAIAAQADGFVRRLPQGYATPAADAPFSGGERQRIGLARAIAHGGRLLLLDDATSSVDSVTELQIDKALRDGLRGTTRIILTHRASVAARADLVAWIEGGRLRALGPHGDLWRVREYRTLFRPEDATADQERSPINVP